MSKSVDRNHGAFCECGDCTFKGNIVHDFLSTGNISAQVRKNKKLEDGIRKTSINSLAIAFENVESTKPNEHPLMTPEELIKETLEGEPDAFLQAIEVAKTKKFNQTMGGFGRSVIGGVERCIGEVILTVRIAVTVEPIMPETLAGEPPE